MDNIKTKRRGRPKKVVLQAIKTPNVLEEDDNDFSSLSNKNFVSPVEETETVDGDGDNETEIEMNPPIENVVEYETQPNEEQEDNDDYVHRMEIPMEIEHLLNKTISKKNTQKRSLDDASVSVSYNSTAMFASKGTEILGKDKRALISKLNQYKNLFPKELEHFKVKKNATVQELEEYLEEASVIVETSSVDQFLTDAILQSIRVIEGVSAHTDKMNICGCADLLKQNKQFHNLTKQLYIKYKVFSAVPCEFQLIILVATTAWVCRLKNSQPSMDKFLDEKI